MSKYSAIRDYLIRAGGETVTVSFGDLSDVVPGGLPPSAYSYEVWWRDGSAGTTHVQCTDGWAAAGYRVDHVNLLAGRVVLNDAAEW